MNDDNDIRNGLQSIAADIDEHASPVTLQEFGGSLDTADHRRLSHHVLVEPVDDRVVDMNPTTEPADGWEPRQRRRVLVGATAGLLVVAGVVGVMAVTRPTPSPAVPLTDPVRTADPNGAFFVLPEPIEDYQLANGYLSTTLQDQNDSVETFARNGVVVGVVDGAGYTDLRSITISETSPIGNTDVRQVDTSTGPAFISNEPITMVAQQRGSQWLGIATLADEHLALDMLDVTTVDETNGIAIDMQAAGLVVLEDHQQRSLSDSYQTYFEATTADGALITVETGTTSSPLLSVASVADRIESTQIDGTGAWIASRDDGDGEWNALVWRATPNRIVVLSGQTEIAEIRHLAESLQVVEQAKWLQALPSATVD